MNDFLIRNRDHMDCPYGLEVKMKTEQGLDIVDEITKAFSPGCMVQMPGEKFNSRELKHSMKLNVKLTIQPTRIMIHNDKKKSGSNFQRFIIYWTDQVVDSKITQKRQYYLRIDSMLLNEINKTISHFKLSISNFPQ